MNFKSDAQRVRYLNSLPVTDSYRGTRFRFCSFQCSRARIKAGVFQVKIVKSWEDEAGWLGALNWIKMMYAQEDYDQALKGAWSANEKSIKIY